MVDGCYLAVKGCSMSLQKISLLYVNGDEVSFRKGHTRDKFEVGENGRPVCVTDSGYGIGYSIQGPLNDEQLGDLRNEVVMWGDLTRPKRIHSVRRWV